MGDQDECFLYTTPWWIGSHTLQGSLWESLCDFIVLPVFIECQQKRWLKMAILICEIFCQKLSTNCLPRGHGVFQPVFGLTTKPACFHRSQCYGTNIWKSWAINSNNFRQLNRCKSINDMTMIVREILMLTLSSHRFRIAPLCNHCYLTR